MSTTVSCTTGPALFDFCRSGVRLYACLRVVLDGRFFAVRLLLRDAARLTNFLRDLVLGLLRFDLLFRGLLLRRVAIFIPHV